MAETRQHQRLVLALVRYLQRVGCEILAADAPGWPRTPLLGGRRPDVLAYYTIGGCMLAGEAKRGPEMWKALAQLDSVAAALPGWGPIGSGGLLILAVEPEWDAEARLLCSVVSRPRTFATVWTPDVPSAPWPRTSVPGHNALSIAE